jgi:metal-responsive CopG/Arc/MetJ family transcriptional regulator
MTDYQEYTEQLERLQELLMALSYLITSMTPEDLDIWTKMKEHLSSREVLENQIVAGDIEELKQMTDTLRQILAKHQ